MNINELLPLIRFHGRTITHPQTGAVFFNWTCGGFTVAFTGKALRARLCVMGDDMPTMPGFSGVKASFTRDMEL